MGRFVDRNQKVVAPLTLPLFGKEIPSMNPNIALRVAPFVVVMAASPCCAELLSSVEQLPSESRRIAHEWQLPQKDSSGNLREVSWIIETHEESRKPYVGRHIDLNAVLTGTWSYEEVWKHYAKMVGADATFPPANARQWDLNKDGDRFLVLQSIEKHRRYTVFSTSTKKHSVQVVLMDDPSKDDPKQRLTVSVMINPN